MNTIARLWNYLSPGARDAVIGGLVLAILATLWNFLSERIRTVFKRLRVKQPSAPPLPPPPRIPRPPTVSFVPRLDRENRDILERLKQELAPEKGQLVVLWGPGGVGKTALAAEGARAFKSVSGQRVVWASAENRADFTLNVLLDEIAAQLGRSELRHLSRESKAAEIRAAIAPTPTLVVLDNFETISPGEQIGCANWLRKEAPCPALITTREKIEQAHNIPVDSMSLKEAASLLDLLIGQSGNSKAFEGLSRESIVQVADANPLALQWVVAQIDLAQDPRLTLADLAKGKGDAAGRIFLHSYNLPQLGDDGRAVLLALSLFVSGASRLALADVAGFDADVKRLSQPLRRLASLRLVNALQKSDYFAIEGLTRELARSRLLQDNKLSQFQQRFVAFFLAFAQNNREKADALEAEKDNLLTALDTAFELTDWASVAVICDVIGHPVKGVLAVRGYWDQVTRAAELGLEAARKAQDESRIAGKAQDLAVMYQRRGDFVGARRLYEEALAILTKRQDREGKARVLNDLGLLEAGVGNLKRAREFAEESLAIKKGLGDQALVATSLHQLGVLAYLQNDLPGAEKFYGESLRAADAAASPSGIASGLRGLGMVETYQGRYKEAREHLGEGLRISGEMRDQEAIARNHDLLGLLDEKEGNLDEAARQYQKALDIFARLKHPNADNVRRSLERTRKVKLPASDVAPPGN